MENGVALKELREAENNAVESFLSGETSRPGSLADLFSKARKRYDDSDKFSEDMNRVQAVYNAVNNAYLGFYNGFEGVDEVEVLEGARSVADEISDEVLSEAYRSYVEDLMDL